jgi:hypothetical protein
VCVCFRANQAETQVVCVESVEVVQEDVVEDGDKDWVSEKKGRSP